MGKLSIDLNCYRVNDVVKIGASAGKLRNKSLVFEVRELKHHTQRLVKRVDFLNYKLDQNHREIQIILR